MLRISILFGLLAFASAVKKKSYWLQHPQHCLHIFHCIKCHQRRISFQRRHFMMFLSSRFSSEKKQYKDCRETLLHFHFHNSSVYVSSEQNCYCWVFICTLSLFLAFNFHPPAKLAKSEDNMGSEPIWSCFCLSAPNAVWGGFCWMVICFWFFENILLFLLLDGDLVLIF